jgi:protein SCO1/2
MKKDGLMLLGAVVGSLLVFAVLGLGLSIAPNLLSPPVPTATVGGLIIDNSHPVRDFELLNQDNKPTHPSDWRGKAVLLFFGYTHCPDVCPLSMGEFKAVKNAIAAQAPALTDKVAFVIISVDGERDTPDVMKNYVTAFDPSFIGLTGTPDRVANIGLDYGVKFEKQRPSGTQAGYLMAHTSYSYLIDPSGNWRVAYPFQTPVDIVTGDIIRLFPK